MATLFEINAELAEILALMQEESEETGEIPESLYARYTDLTLAKEEKTENLALYLLQLASDRDSIKAEEERLAQRRKRLERQAERLKGLLDYELAGKTFKTPLVSCRYRKSQRVDVLDLASIPERYCRIETVKTPDKKAIKEAIKKGEEVQGVALIDAQNLSIQ